MTACYSGHDAFAGGGIAGDLEGKQGAPAFLAPRWIAVWKSDDDTVIEGRNRHRRMIVNNEEIESGGSA